MLVYGQHQPLLGQWGTAEIKRKTRLLTAATFLVERRFPKTKAARHGALSGLGILHLRRELLQRGDGRRRVVEDE